MKQPLSKLIFALALLLSGGTAFAQAPELLVTAGTTVVSPVDGQRWAYIFWQTSNADDLKDYQLAIYARDGGTESGPDFVRQTILLPTEDTRTLNARIRRAIHLGDDLSLLESRLDQLFAPLEPPTLGPDSVDLGLAQKLGLLLLAAETDAELAQNLSTMGRAHPAIELARGTAFAQPVSGIRTYEVRLYTQAGAALGVIGRVTVNGSAPVPRLPAPSAPVNIEPATDGLDDHTRRFRLQTMDLVARLRWGAPESLARLSALRHGYRLYRVERAVAETSGWHVAPPPAGVLESQWNGTSIARVNQAPILPDIDYTPAEASDLSMDDYFLVDDLRLVDGAAFTHGSQYYYFVAALDVLGREGDYSEGTLVTMLNRLPAQSPDNVKVQEEFQWDQSLGADERLLRILWDPEPPIVPGPTDQVRERGPTVYHVFRWPNAEEFVRYPSTLDVSLTNSAGRIYGRITPPGGLTFAEGEPLTFLDNTTDAPNADDARIVFWYTVMSVELGPDGEPLNLSAHSAPASGVIRAFLPLDAPIGRIFYDCAVPVVLTNKAPALTLDSTTNARGRVTLTVTFTNSAPAGIDWVELSLAGEVKSWYRPPAADSAWTKEFIFSPSEYMALRNSAGGVGATLIGAGEVRSAAASYPGAALPDLSAEFLKYGVNINMDVALGFVGSMDVSRVSSDDDCSGIEYADGYPGADGNPPDIRPRGEAEYPVGTVEFRVYRSIDGGDLVLVDSGIITNAPPAPSPSGFRTLNANNRITVPFGLDEAVIPRVPSGGEVCYYFQGLDIDGNGSPFDRQCVEVDPDPNVAGEQALTVPLMLEPVYIGEGTMADPAKVRIRWNLSLQNAEWFRVLVSPRGATPPETFAVTGLEVKARDLRLVGERFGVYDIRVSRTRQFENDLVVPGLYGIDLPVDPGREYTVRVAPLRRAGANRRSLQMSEPVVVRWTAARADRSLADDQDAVLPWLPQAMPAISELDAPVRAEFLDDVDGFTGVGIRIGSTDLSSFTSAPFKGSKTSGGLPATWIRGRWAPDWLVYSHRDRVDGSGEAVRETVLPFVLYRYRVPPGAENDPDLIRRADVVQVTPLREEIVLQYDEDDLAGDITLIQDRFAAVRSDGGSKIDLFLVDTQPVVRGESYRYVLVRFDELGEIEGLYRVPAVDAFGQPSPSLRIPD